MPSAPPAGGSAGQPLPMSMPTVNVGAVRMSTKQQPSFPAPASSALGSAFSTSQSLPADTGSSSSSSRSSSASTFERARQAHLFTAAQLRKETEEHRLAQQRRLEEMHARATGRAFVAEQQDHNRSGMQDSNTGSGGRSGGNGAGWDSGNRKPYSPLGSSSSSRQQQLHHYHRGPITSSPARYLGQGSAPLLSGDPHRHQHDEHGRITEYGIAAAGSNSGSGGSGGASLGWAGDDHGGDADAALRYGEPRQTDDARASLLQHDQLRGREFDPFVWEPFNADTRAAGTAAAAGTEQPFQVEAGTGPSQLRPLSKPVLKQPAGSTSRSKPGAAPAWAPPGGSAGKADASTFAAAHSSDADEQANEWSAAYSAPSPGAPEQQQQPLLMGTMAAGAGLGWPPTASSARGSAGSRQAGLGIPTAGRMQPSATASAAMATHVYAPHESEDDIAARLRQRMAELKITRGW